MTEKIFYAFSLLAIVWEAIVLCNAQYVTLFRERLRRTVKFNSEAATPEHRIRYASGMHTFAIFDVVYGTWVWVGLFSTQWPMVIALRLCTLIPKNRASTYRFDAAVSLVLLCAILYNKYFLRYQFSPKYLFSFLTD